MSIKWYTQPDTSQAKPHQFYFHGEPCDILAIGARKGEKVPCVHKLRTASGKVHLVWAKNGICPGVTYDIFNHDPGTA